MHRGLFAAAAVALLVTGCAGYQYGDVSNRVIEAQRSYCAEDDPEARAVRVRALHRLGIGVPDDGACADILEALGDVSE